MAGPPSGVDLLPSMPPLTIIIPRFTSYEPVIVFPSTSMLISFVMSSQNVESEALFRTDGNGITVCVQMNDGLHSWSICRALSGASFSRDFKIGSVVNDLS